MEFLQQRKSCRFQFTFIFIILQCAKLRIHTVLYVHNLVDGCTILWDYEPGLCMCKCIIQRGTSNTLRYMYA